MSRYFQTTVTREGWYYVLIVALVFTGAMLREVNLLLILAGLLLGPLLFNWRAVGVMLRGLDVRRRVPQGVCAGDLLVANVTLTNRRRRIGSWAVVVEDQIHREGDGRRERPLKPHVLFPYLPARQERKAAYRGRLVRRGRYRLGPLRLSTRFPFGLLSRTVVVGGTETLTVLPRLGRLTQGWAARRLEAFSGAHRRERRHGLEGDFYGLRSWRSGDCRRWIHWRSSARRGELLVRQLEQPRNRDLSVVLDLWQPPRPSPEQYDNVELAVSFAATVLAELCRKGGSTLHLALADPQPACLSGPASAALLQGMMERLAVVEAQSDDRLPETLAHAFPQLDPGTELVLVTTRPVDLSDAARFGAICSEPVRRGLLRRMRSVDASSEDLNQYFVPE